MTTFSPFLNASTPDKLVLQNILHRITEISNFYLITTSRHWAAKKSLPQKHNIKLISHALGYKMEEKKIFKPCIPLTFPQNG